MLGSKQEWVQRRPRAWSRSGVADVGAIEQVAHVIVRASFLVDLGLQLVVERLKLFVEGQRFAGQQSASKW